MTDFIQVVTTTGKQSEAAGIAELLIDKRLAACVQVAGPVASTYRWEGKIERAQEWQCIAKTRLSLFHDLKEAILSVHPYDVPEIIATRVEAGHAPYLNWIEQQVSPASD